MTDESQRAQSGGGVAEPIGSPVAPADADRVGSRPLVIPVWQLAVWAFVATAAALRLSHLDWMPLDPQEATAALAAAGIEPAGQTSALLHHSLRLLFWFFGSGDSVSRMASVLAGVGLVIAVAALAPFVGRSGALAAAGLTALSPGWVYFGRHVSPGMLAALAAAVGLYALATAPARRRWAVPLALGALLAAGPGGITPLVAILIVVVLPWPEKPDVEEWFKSTWPTRETRLMAAAVFAVTFAGLATGWLTQPEGLRAALEAPAVWLGRLAAVGRGTGAILPLVLHAPVELVFGAVGIGILATSRPAAAVGLTVWSGVGLVTAGLAATPTVLPEVLLPLTLAAGAGIAHLLDELVRRWRWEEDGLMTAVLLIVICYAVLHFAMVAELGGDAGARDLAVGGVVMALVLTAAFAVLWGRDLARRSAGVAALVVLGLWAWSQSGNLLYVPTTFLREPMRPHYVPKDQGLLIRALEDRNVQRVTIGADPRLGPGLRWALARFPNTEWGRLVADANQEALLAPAGEAVGATNRPYHMAVYRVAGRWTPMAGELQDRLRWLLHRHAPRGPTPAPEHEFETVQLLLRAEE